MAHSDTHVSETGPSPVDLRPVFDALLEWSPRGSRWLRGLWELAATRRPAMAVPAPTAPGKLLHDDTPRDAAARAGTLYDRPIAPPAAFLQWVIEHPRAMHVRDAATFGAKSEEARAWRAKLFSDNPALVAAAQTEALTLLGKRLAQRGRNKWWAFEGFLRVDCCLSTEECVVFVDGKSAASAAPSTVWFPQRSQVWRHVEAAREMAGNRQFAVILAVRDEAEGAAALAAAAATLDHSYPHLDLEQRAELSRHLLGFVTPEQIGALRSGDT